MAGLLKAQERFGRLSRVEVMAPSIQLADEGFVIYPQLADSLKRAFPRLSKDPTARSLFYRQDELSDGGPQWIPYQSGEQLRQPELAQSLKLISSKGSAGFYEGTTADQIVALMKSQGGLIDHRDLSDFTAPWVEPVKGIFRAHTVISMPPPSSGGITLLQILKLIESFDLESLGTNSADSIHLLTESMNLAYRDRNQFLGDPDQIDIPVRRLLSHSYIDSLRNQLNLSSHTSAVDLAGQAPLSSGVNTTHLSVADRDGSLVALTTTLNFAYGNGIAVPGAGFLLNNELADFTAKPGVPNAYGLVQGEQNAVAPSRRPLSSMTPTIVLNQEGDSWLATGSPGGSRIITTVVQVLLNRIIHGLNLATSVATPRIHSQLWPDSVQLEQGFSPDTLELLKQRGHALRFTRSMGSANSVELKPNGGSFGVADPRRPEGAAIADAYDMRPAFADTVAMAMSAGTYHSLFGRGHPAIAEHCQKALRLFCTDNRDGQARIIVGLHDPDSDHFDRKVIAVTEVNDSLPKPFDHERIEVKIKVDDNLVLLIDAKGATQPVEKSVRAEVVDLRYSVSLAGL